MGYIFTGSSLSRARDPNYRGSWVSDQESIEIIEYFRKNGFVPLDAVELKRWMDQVIKDRIRNAVVVFSVDVIPARAHDLEKDMKERCERDGEKTI